MSHFDRFSGYGIDCTFEGRKIKAQFVHVAYIYIKVRLFMGILYPPRLGACMLKPTTHKSDTPRDLIT